jgi:myo-inositol 2-dehydrogenase/D-chiro-inositol 1-dehydrogenase
MLLPQLVRHDVEIAALCDIDADRLVHASRQFGVGRLTSDAAELIATPGLDAVGMAVGPGQHLTFGLAALGRGLPVFMEKPPAATAAGARELLKASEAAGKPLLVGFMKRYSVGNRIARNIIASGRFGRVLGLTGYYMTAPNYFTGNVD